MATVEVEGWRGTWGPEDRDGAFKERVRASALVDPLPTLENLGAATGIPVGGLVHHVLVEWTTAGARGLLELGPSEAAQLLALAEAGDLDGLRGRLQWLVSGS